MRISFLHSASREPNMRDSSSPPPHLLVKFSFSTSIPGKESWILRQSRSVLSAQLLGSSTSSSAITHPSFHFHLSTLNLPSVFVSQLPPPCSATQNFPPLSCLSISHLGKQEAYGCSAQDLTCLVTLGEPIWCLERRLDSYMANRKVLLFREHIRRYAQEKHHGSTL